MPTALLSDPMDALEELRKLSSTTLPAVEVYTDGACSGNPGPGGYGAVILYAACQTDLSGSDPMTTNNRMEMLGAISALKALPLRCKVTLHTDSMYVKDGVTLWMPKWKLNGWKTADKRDVKNQDLWQELDQLLSTQEIHWKWVKGHAGHEMNERADTLARNAIIAMQIRG